jgi:hypothetical protein
MAKNKNNVYFLLLALALAFILMPVLTQAVSAADQLKRLHITVEDDETGHKVTAECLITAMPRDEDEVGGTVRKETNSGGEATVTLDKDATSARISCSSAAGATGGSTGDKTVPLRENGTTHVTIVV